MLSVPPLWNLLLCGTKATNHLNPIIISKIVFGVNGKEDEKLMRRKRNARNEMQS